MTWISRPTFFGSFDNGKDVEDEDEDLEEGEEEEDTGSTGRPTCCTTIGEVGIGGSGGVGGTTIVVVDCNDDVGVADPRTAAWFLLYCSWWW